MKVNSEFSSPNCETNNQIISFKKLPEHPFYMPEIVAKTGKVAGKYIGLPEQKLILSMAALCIQPAIELMTVDDDKKHDAAIKSAAKIIAGAVSGVTIRNITISIAQKYIAIDKDNILKKYFLPDEVNKLIMNKGRVGYEEAVRRLKLYNDVLGTIAALVIMCLFTNKNFDVPLTSDLQDLFSGVIKENKTWIKSLTDVYTARYSKIYNWIDKRKTKVNKVLNKVIELYDVISGKDVKKQRVKTNE